MKNNCFFSMIAIAMLFTSIKSSASETPTQEEDKKSLLNPYSMQIAVDVKESHLDNVEPDETTTFSIQGSLGKRFSINHRFSTETRLFISLLYESFDNAGVSKNNAENRSVILTEYEGRNYQLEGGIKQQINFSLIPKKWFLHLGVGFSYSFEDMEIETEVDRSTYVLGSTHNHWQFDSSRISYRLIAYTGAKYFWRDDFGIFFNLEFSRLNPTKINSSERSFIINGDSPALRPASVNYSDQKEYQNSFILGLEKTF